eukprot:3918336-Alexandrium_andersonii.AAC.1
MQQVSNASGSSGRGNAGQDLQKTCPEQALNHFRRARRRCRIGALIGWIVRGIVAWGSGHRHLVPAW